MAILDIKLRNVNQKKVCSNVWGNQENVSNTKLFNGKIWPRWNNKATKVAIFEKNAQFMHCDIWLFKEHSHIFLTLDYGLTNHWRGKTFRTT